MSTPTSAFFDALRPLFGGSFNQGQIDGLNMIAARSDGLPLHQQAYVFATAFHEVNRTMQPIREYGGDRYFFEMYDIEGDRPHVARDLGNVGKGDGVRFHGRGFVQLTGRANYADWEQRLDVDLTSSRKAADRVLHPEIAATILVDGMRLGTFTGKKLSDYIDGVRVDYWNARRIVNRMDRADDIAKYAASFENALQIDAKASKRAPRKRTGLRRLFRKFRERF